MHGVIYVSLYMEAYSMSSSDRKRFDGMQWQARLKNALWCYHKAHNQEERQEVVRMYKQEFERLGWRV